MSYYVIQAIDCNRRQGYVQYPGKEYEVVEFKEASRYQSKKDAEHDQAWYNRRGGIYMDMKVLEIIDWIGHCKRCKTFYRPIQRSKKWYSMNLAYPNNKTLISRPKCCCPNQNCHAGEFEQEAFQ